MVTSVTNFAARDAADVEEIIRAAGAGSRPLEIVGRGTKRALGRPVAAEAALDLSALDKITLYEPEELVLTVEAGAPVDAVVAALAAMNQELAFEPMDVSGLLGATGGGTIAGMLATGFAGPRRVKAGGARDHFLGATAVSGFGETFKSGGRVVKNVTGYDLCKLLAGSWGTLAVMTEVTLKVSPKAETEVTLVLDGPAGEAAGRAMTAALGSSCDVSGAAHFPASALRGPLSLGAGGTLGAERAATLMRLEGIAVSVAERAETLRAMLSGSGKVERLDAADSAALWRRVRDVEPFSRAGPLSAWSLWRIVCPPARGCRLGEEIARACGGDAVIDWGGGLIWLAVPPSADAFATLVREAVAAAGGHAMLFRADAAMRGQVPVFGPLGDGIAVLNRAIKANFDPLAILNPGRMYAGGAS
jgi:glycolate oxidase FAD binding subunit